jgi:3-hydroxyacyl-CoA dehydrogenase/enoyl-CoA hydratase/3-hydroxybutyryl-CoA epimerase
VNRILGAYLNEAAYLFEEGLGIKEIDQAAVDFGMPMGPLRLMDEIGLDVAKKVGIILHQGLGERMKPCTLSGKLVESGLLGKKGLKGFYIYNSAGKEESANADLLSLQKSKKNLEVQYIQMRLILPMINEAASCLEEGIISKASDVDLALIYGIGFPPFRGGLLKFADDQGVQRLRPFFSEFFNEVSSQRYAVTKFLADLMESNKRFY